jgi:hypothetical protein
MIVSNVVFFNFLMSKFFATLPPKLRKFCQNYTKKTKISGQKSEFSQKKKKHTSCKCQYGSSQQGVKWVKLIKHSQTLKQNHVLCTRLSTIINQQKYVGQSLFEGV